MADGVAYGRLSPDEEWEQLDSNPDLFAPGGDPMGFLNAAGNIVHVSGEATSEMADGTGIRTVSSDPTSIACPGDCQELFAYPS